MSDRLCVLGAGSWGTALAVALSSRFETVGVWSHNAQRAQELQQSRENRRYLPGFTLPTNVFVSHRPADVLKGAGIVLSVLPSYAVRTTLHAMRFDLTASTRLVSATKGLELQTLRRMSQVMAEALEIEERSVAILSGPTFAREIAAGEPAAMVIACRDLALAEEMQRAFATSHLRFYASDDPVGVEIGAALKNVIAIGAGICKGLGLGSNSVAALITRGLAEITRIAVHLGGHPRTLSGLAGLGDLVLTATGDLSRNRGLGVALGQGCALSDVLASMTMVAEGVDTCRATHELGVREKMDLPIINQMFAVLYQAKDPRRAIQDLMERPLTTE